MPREHYFAVLKSIIEQNVFQNRKMQASLQPLCTSSSLLQMSSASFHSVDLVLLYPIEDHVNYSFAILKYG
jgi:hypothetical protein